MDEAPITPVPVAEPEAPFEPVVFDNQAKGDFEALLWLGKLTHTFSWQGHEFVIKTLTIGEMLEIGLLHAPYIGSYGDIRAWQSLVLAASILSVDREPLALPMGENENPLYAKFNFIREKWYPWTLDAIYAEYLALDARVGRTIQEMDRAVGSMV